VSVTFRLEHPLIAVTADSGSPTDQVSATGPRYQFVEHGVPLHSGTMTGGVISAPDGVTVYDVEVDAALPARSVALTVNVCVPTALVLIGAPLATGPVHTAMPEGASVQA
jgi:hypothetical protein